MFQKTDSTGPTVSTPQTSFRMAEGGSRARGNRRVPQKNRPVAPRGVLEHERRRTLWNHQFCARGSSILQDGGRRMGLAKIGQQTRAPQHNSKTAAWESSGENE